MIFFCIGYFLINRVKFMYYTAYIYSFLRYIGHLNFANVANTFKLLQTVRLIIDAFYIKGVILNRYPQVPPGIPRYPQVSPGIPRYPHPKKGSIPRYPQVSPTKKHGIPIQKHLLSLK